MDQAIKSFVRDVDWKKKLSSVKNTVMNISPLEAKVREVTSNDPWAASASDKQIVATHTHNFEEYRVVMGTMWRRMNDSGKNWRHVLKALQLLEYLVIHGSDRVADEARNNIYTIRTLRNFRYVDERGKDHGSSVRDLARSLTNLLKDDREIRKRKKEARKNQNKYAGISASDARYQVRRNRYNRDSNGTPSSSSYNDEDDDYERRSRRRDSFDSDNSSRRYRDDDDDRDEHSRNRGRHEDGRDAFDEYSRQERSDSIGGESAGGFRPRKVSQAASEGTAPKERMRAPSFGSGDTSSRQQQPAAVQEANIFDVSDFFDTPPQPAAVPQRQQPQQKSSSNMGFNPQSSPPQQQEWSANFESNGSDAFGDDAWGNFPSDGAVAVNNNNNNRNNNDNNNFDNTVPASNDGFDAAFPDDDDFANFQPGVADSKEHDDLWGATKELVQLDLGDKPSTQQRQTMAASQKQAPPKKMSLKEMQRKQGGGAANRPAPSTVPPGPAAAAVPGPFGGPSMGFAQPSMGFAQPPMGFAQPPMGYGNMPPPGFAPQMGSGGGMMQQWGPQQQQQRQQQPQQSSTTQSNNADDFFF